MVCPKMVCP